MGGGFGEVGEGESPLGRGFLCWGSGGGGGEGVFVVFFAVDDFDVPDGCHIEVAVLGHASAGGDKAAHDDVLFEAAEVVGFTGDGGFGEDFGGFLEGGGGDKGLGGERGFGDTEEEVFGDGGLEAFVDHLAVFVFEGEAFDLFIDEEIGVADLADFNAAEHLANDGFDVFVVDGDALEAVDLLDFVDEEFGECFAAHDFEDVVGVGGAFHEGVASADAVAGVDGEVFAFGDEVFFGFADIGADDEAAFAFGVFTKFDFAFDVGDDGLFFGFAGLEEFRNARQTTGNIFRFRCFAGDFGEGGAGVNDFVFFDEDVGLDGEDVGGEGFGFGFLGVADGDGGAFVGVFELDNDLAGEAGDFVEFLLHGLAFDDVFEFNEAAFFGQNGGREGVPFGECLAFLNNIVFFDFEAGTVDEGVAFAFAGTFDVVDGDFAVAVHDDERAAFALDGVDVVELDATGVAALVGGGFGLHHADAAGVEGAHGELGAGFTDGLRGDDADGFTDVDEATAREVATVAEDADALFCLAGEHGADVDFAQTSLADFIDSDLVDFLVGIDEQVPVLVFDGEEGHSSEDTVTEVFDDFATFDEGFHLNAVEGAAVVFADDGVLGDVDEAAGQVTGVGGFKGGIGETFTRTVGGDEVLEDGESFAEVGADGGLDDFAGGFGHEAAHTGKLTDLGGGATGTGVGHDVDRVKRANFLACAGFGVDDLFGGDPVHHLFGDAFGGLCPDIDDLVIALAFGDETAVVLFPDFLNFGLGLVKDGLFAGGDDHVVHADGDTSAHGFVVADGADVVGHEDGGLVASGAVGHVDELGECFLVEGFVDDLKRKGFGEEFVEEDATDGGVDALAFVADLDGGLEVDLVGVVGDADLIKAGEEPLGGAAFGVFAIATECEGALTGHVVATEDDVLGGADDGRARGGGEDVVGGEEEDTGLHLGFDGEGDVDGHLVAVEVGVKGGADEGVKLDGFAFDEDGFESLDAEAVEGGSAVEEDGVFFDDFVKDVPDFGAFFFDEFFSALDGVDVALLFKLVVNKGFEEFERHLLGQAALVEAQGGADDDDRTTGVVDAFTQEVLAEAALFTLEHVGEGLEGALVGSGDGFAAAAVVEEGIDGFLEHALFVADDDLRSVEFLEAAQAVVAVDDAAVEVVEVAGGEAAAVEGDEGAEVGRDDGDDFEDHPFGAVGGVAAIGAGVGGGAEGLDDLEALGDFFAFGLAGGLFHFGAEVLG